MRPAYMILMGFPSRTISIPCTDLPQSIPEVELVFETKPVIAMLFSHENGDVRYTFGDTAPDQTTPVGHVTSYFSIPIYVANPKAVRTFQFCNALVGQQLNAIMHITLFFEIQ